MKEHRRNTFSGSQTSMPFAPGLSRLINLVFYIADCVSKKEQFGDLIAKMDGLLEKLTHEPAFKPILDRTMLALADVRHEWEANYVKAHDILEHLSGLSFDRDIKVYILHPAYPQFYRHGKDIYCTFSQRSPNEVTLALWKEIVLPMIKPGQAKDESDRLNREYYVELVAALLVDEELRVQLNGGQYPPFYAADRLQRYEKTLLPGWREYLAQKGSKDIMSYFEQTRKFLTDEWEKSRKK
jgi:hypothetical protein